MLEFSGGFLNCPVTTLSPWEFILQTPPDRKELDRGTGEGLGDLASLGTWGKE